MGIPDGASSAAALNPPKPQVRIKSAAGAANLSRPAKATDYVLETATALPVVSWATVTNTPAVTATNRRVQLPLTAPAQFFRLRRL